MYKEHKPERTKVIPHAAVDRSSVIHRQGQHWLLGVQPVETNASTAQQDTAFSGRWYSGRPHIAVLWEAGRAVHTRMRTANPASTSDTLLPLGARRQVIHEQRRVAGV